MQDKTLTEELQEVCQELYEWHISLADPQWDGSPVQVRAEKALERAKEVLK